MVPAILLQLLIVLLITGVLLWAVQQFPLDPVIARIIRVVVVVLCVIWVVYALLGVAGPMPHFVR